MLNNKILAKLSKELLHHYVIFAVLETSAIGDIVLFFAIVCLVLYYFEQSKAENFKQEKLLMSKLLLFLASERKSSLVLEKNISQFLKLLTSQLELALALEINNPHFLLSEDDQVLRSVMYPEHYLIENS